MNIFDNISDKNLHHAYLVVGDVLASRESIFGFLPSVGVQTHGNADLRHTRHDTLTIDIARDIALAVAQKDFGGSKKIFIIETNIITEEAQNALLKVFEEPTVGTHFFIIMPQDILLSTLRSRMQVIQGLPLESSNQEKKSLSILKMQITERLALVKEITDGISDEEKTKQDAISLLNQIESELYAKGVENKSDALELCQSTRLAIYNRGAPVKMILEQLMITI